MLHEPYGTVSQLLRVNVQQVARFNRSGIVVCIFSGLSTPIDLFEHKGEEPGYCPHSGERLVPTKSS